MTEMTSTSESAPRAARRVADIAPFHVMDVLARAKELEESGRHIVHMEIGEPDFATAAPIVEAGVAALRAGHTHYTPARGLPALRRAIAGHYAQRYGIEVSPQRILVTAGASAALQLVMAALVEPGASVLLADPGYPCNRHFVRVFEGRPLGVAVDAQSRYQLTAEDVDRHAESHPSVVMLASPSNPTGTTVSLARMGAILERTRRLGARLVVDEIYQGLVYEGEAQSALALAPEGGAGAEEQDLFVVNSFSKYFGMTGWRLGWLVAPSLFVRDLEKLAANLFISAPSVAQYAALAAFEPATLEILEARRRQFQARRDFLVPALRELGFDIPVVPDGAFYLYAGCGRFTDDSHRFALEVLERAGVAITPGLDFGTNDPARHVRFAYTTAMDELYEAVQRLARFLG